MKKISKISNYFWILFFSRGLIPFFKDGKRCESGCDGDVCVMFVWCVGMSEVIG